MICETLRLGVKNNINPKNQKTLLYTNKQKTKNQNETVNKRREGFLQLVYIR